jgi:hypothetical protein
MKGSCPCGRIFQFGHFRTFSDIPRYSDVKEQHTSPQVTGALRARVTNGATCFVESPILSRNRRKNPSPKAVFVFGALRNRRRAAQRALRANLKLQCDVNQSIFSRG